MQPEQGTAPGRQEGALASYLFAIRSHRLLVIAVTLAAVLASIGFLAVRSPRYEAITDLLVDAVPQEDQTFIGLPVLRDTGDPTRTMQTAAALVESRAAADAAAQRLGGDWTGKRVLDRVEISPAGESNILAIIATGDTAGESARIANEFARAALEVRSNALSEEARGLIAELEARLRNTPEADQVTRAELSTRLQQLESVAEAGDPTLEVSQQAIPPGSASGASPALIVALALIAGLTLGSGTAMLLELVTRRVRDLQEAVEIYPLPVLARVPDLSERKRRGPPGSIWYMPPEVREPFLTLAVQLDELDGARGRGSSRAAVMITSPSSGDGKTSSAISLAVSLVASGKRVVLLDFDLRKPQVAASLGIEEPHRLTALVNPDARLEDLLVPASQLQSLQVLPLVADPEDVGLAEVASQVLPDFIEQARRIADYVVVDTAPLGEVADPLRLARQVDEILVVMRPGNTNRGHLEVLRGLLDRVDRSPIGYVVFTDEARTVGGYGYGTYGASGVARTKPQAGDPGVVWGGGKNAS